MIELTPLARPYAKALFASTLELDATRETSNDLKLMAKISSSPEVKRLIENPTISKKELNKNMNDLFVGSISDPSNTLIKILSENKRLNLIPSISDIYQKLLEKHKQQQSITVFAAKKPSDEAKVNIENKLRSTHGKESKISFSIDPNMMGGLFIKIGDETLDLSIKGKVKKLVNQLNF